MICKLELKSVFTTIIMTNKEEKENKDTWLCEYCIANTILGKMVQDNVVVRILRKQK